MMRSVNQNDSIEDQLSSAEEQTEEDYENAMAHPLRFAKAKLLSYSMHDLERSWLRTLLALWHVYLFWVSGVVVMAVGANELLRWWIRWYREIGGADYEVNALVAFFGNLGKSWIWICFASEVLRFCYMLGVDAFRVDSFEAYRRTLLAELLPTDMKAGLYGLGWRRSLTKSHRGYDLCLQAFIYVTLDVIPFVVFVVNSIRKGRATMISTTFLCTPVACLHVLIFYSAWTVTEIVNKVIMFREAYREGTAWSESDASNSDDGLEHQNDFAHNDIGEGRAPLAATKALMRTGASVWADGAYEQEQKDRNLCVYLCKCCIVVEQLVPHFVWISAVLYGLVKGSLLLVVGGLFMMMLLICYSGGMITSTLAVATTPCKRRATPLLDALEEWGEQHGLDRESQAYSRLVPLILLVILGEMFASNNWWACMVTCMIGITYLVVKQSVIFIERPMCWLIGSLEGIVFHVVVALMVFVPSHREHQPIDFLLVVALSIARIFGLKTRLKDGSTVKTIATFWLCLVMLVIIWILVHTIDSGGHVKEFTALCPTDDAGKPLANCSITSFPYTDLSGHAWPQCSLRFATKGQNEPLTLADFGRMSALTYEQFTTIDAGFKEYFPGWYIEERHFVHSPHADDLTKETGLNDMDWTTFYMFTDKANGTSVFAVRGTQYLIDVLQDVDLWLPATTMMMFEKLGPNLHSSFVDAVAHLTTTGRRETEKKAFDTLLDSVRAAMKRHPDREFFITGHSLGGGVAKLVAAEVGRLEPGSHLPAIVFAAPGVAATSYVVFGHDLDSQVAQSSITVRPQNDIVSKVDDQISGTVPVYCDGNALSCHSIFNTLCAIYDACGSMRPGENMTVQKTTCPTIPHKDVVAQ